MTSIQYKDSCVEITCHGSHGVVHDFISNRYFEVDKKILSTQPFTWKKYSSRLKPWHTTCFFISFLLMLILNYGWLMVHPPQPITLSVTIVLACFLALNIALHEAAHITALRICGRKPDRVGFKLNYGILPAFFVRMNQALLLNKREKLFCHLAGLWANLLVVTAVVMLDLLHLLPMEFHVVLYLFLAMLTMNIMPVLNTDGQKVVTTLLDISETKKWRSAKPTLWLIRIGSVIFLIIMLAQASASLLGSING